MRTWALFSVGYLLATAAMPAVAQQKTNPIPPSWKDGPPIAQASLDPQRPHREWEDPTIFAVHREAPHATLFNYESVAQAQRGKAAESERHLSLDGTWKFHWSRNPSERPAEFWKPGFDVSGWNDMPVPGIIEAQGYDRPYYVNIGYAFPMNQPLVPDDYAPVGSYRRSFDLPAGWHGQDVFLRFNGVGSAIYVWVNGRKVGYSENTKNAAEFKVTEYLKAGRNDIAVEVYRFSDGSYLEDQDMWRVSGFERPVELFAVPKAWVRDYFAKAGLAEGYRDGTLDLSVDLASGAGGQGAYSVEAILSDQQGQPVWSERRSVTLADGTTGSVRFSTRLAEVRRWTAETPNLYGLMLVVRDDAGAVLSAVPGHIGFRDIAIRDGQLMVNGQPITIRGVNLHEHDPDTIKVVSEATLEARIRQMRAMNVNAIRTSHYPQRAAFYDLADRYGMYVVDESNIESHGYYEAGFGIGPQEKWQLGHKPEWEAAHLDRMRSLVETDKNHPSIIAWSLGNEAGGGPAFQKMYDWAKRRDPTRPVQYQAAGMKPPFTDMVVPFYPNQAAIAKWAQEFRQTPIIMTEYAHMMGNSGGDFADLWDEIRKHPNTQGGFIWDWIDQGLNYRHPDGSRFHAYGGDPGPLMLSQTQSPESLRGSFVANGMIGTEGRPNPHAYEVRHVYQPAAFAAADDGDGSGTGAVRVTNRFDFLDLDRFDIVCTMLEDGVEQGSCGRQRLSVPARGSGVFPLQRPAGRPKPGAEYVARLALVTREDSLPMTAAGTTVATDEIVFPAAPAAAPAKAAGRVELRETGTAWQITGPGYAARFDSATGELVSLRGRAGELVEAAPRPNFWRPATDNDIGWNMPAKLAVWKEASLNRALTGFSAQRQGDGVEVQVVQTVGDNVAWVRTRYRFAPTGDIVVTETIEDGRKDLPVLPRFGWTMRMPEAFDQLAWYGRGPWESYADRKSGAMLGRYKGAVRDQYHPYIRPQETGNKTDLRWMAVTDGAGNGLLISGAAPFSGAALALDPMHLDYDRLAPNRHGLDVKPEGFTTLTVDHAQMGVGGDNSWGAQPMTKYQLPFRHYSFTVRLRPLTAGDDPAQIARTAIPEHGGAAPAR
ncbi:glycoside hydrolase family 2 TIM barrel-domain containing protein [Sphingomonas sp. ac-8]|uniref:glycoside hydrolase family 2 TIM barrel-domain containing protein n=1 Tax=Sphingomonas sp. ac-8 TaxID=3242977 RepID=UPI003A7F67E5